MHRRYIIDITVAINTNFSLSLVIGVLFSLDAEYVAVSSMISYCTN